MRSFFQFCLLVVLGVFIAVAPVIVSSFSPVAAQTAPDQSVQTQVQQALLDSMQPTDLGPPASAVKTADRIQIQGNYAVAHWTWGEDAGGWALLQNLSGTWSVVTRRSDAITPQMVASFGVPADIAQLLVNAYDPNWQNYPSP